MPKLRQQTIRPNGLKKIALATIILVSLIRGGTLEGSTPTLAYQSDLSGLPLTFPAQTPEIVAYFNKIARPQDIASFPPMAIHLLPQVTAGQKMVGFFSWAEAESKLDELIDQIDIVMYNPEHWEHTPTDEQENLVVTVQRAAEFAHTRGLRFMFAPDRRYAEAHLGEVAPYVDMVLLQGQRVQHDPQTFASWLLNMINTARTANPEIEVYVQVGATRGTALEMFTAIQTVANDIDGIAVWYMPRTLDILQEFVTLLQGSPAAFAPTPSP